MKVLFAVSHYFKGIDSNTRYGSHSIEMRDRRRLVLDTLIFKIHQLFGGLHYGARHHLMGLAQLPNHCAFDFDIVICTTGDGHLINELTCPPDWFRHVPTDAPPLFLGFAVQKVMREERGKYDYYCYLEDDIIIHDPLFFRKLEFFNKATPMEQLLQPQRFELSMHSGGVRKPFLTKLYPDYQAREIPADLPGYSFELLGTKINLGRTSHPHAGSFFLNAEQFEYLAGKPEFANSEGIDINMALDLAATLAIMRNFTIFKPAGDSMGFFEVEHGCCNMLNQVNADENGEIYWRWSEKDFAAVDMARMAGKETESRQSPDEDEQVLELCKQGESEAEKGNIADAAILFRKACILSPQCWEAWYHLGEILYRGNNAGEAENCFRRAVALNPGLAEGHESLGIVLQGEGKTEEAIVCYNRTLELNPASVKAAYNTATALEWQERYEEAISAYRKVLVLAPDHSEARWYLSGLLLLTGNLTEGWREYERRWEVPNFSTPKRNFVPPLWDGGDIQGKTILVHMEQGFGDMLQFIRYAPMLAARGGTVAVACAVELKRLMTSVPGVSTVLVNGDRWCHFDVHAPVMSLPYLFNTSPNDIPADVPYLAPDRELIAAWKERMRMGDNGSFKVGLVWGGRQDHPLTRDRSCPLALFSPLAAVPDTVFFSLQVGDGAEQAANPPSGMRLFDLSPGIADFADVAAIMANLDLVISIDTAAAHLAGALGRPVWTLLKRGADWRWLLGRDDSPWYPTMRLFRQERRGEWGEVLERVALELGKMRRRSS